VRVRDHVVLSTASSVMLGRRRGRRAIAFWAAAIGVDVDHYVWFCLRRRRLNPLAAARFFNQPEAPQHARTRLLHQPLALLAIALLAVRRRGAREVAMGMAMHIVLDLNHERRMHQARIDALQRDAFTCRRCGASGSEIGTHLWRQPWFLPSYRAHNLVALCNRCHNDVHASVLRGVSSDSALRP
jgi:hypothetical protein